MELRSLLMALARSWPLVIVCTLLGGEAGWIVTNMSKPVYKAHAQLFVSTQARGDTADLQQGSTFSLARVQSYASIVTSRAVTQHVVSALHLHTSPDKLAKQITAEAPMGTVLVNISVADTDRRRAADVANAVAQRFSDVVEHLEGHDVPASAGTDEDGESRPPMASSPQTLRSPVKLGVTQAASVPTSPVSPQPVLNLAAGLLVGFLLGATVAVLRNTLDTSFKDVEALAAQTKLPVLSTIPLDKESRGQSLVNGNSHSARAEAYRHLRSSLQFAQIGNRARVLVVTSSLPNEGKTSTAANLALALAESGTSTCLIDADLRRPRVASMFGLVRDAGLTNVLIGQASVREVLQSAGSLSVLTSGPLPPNPAELLSCDRMARVLQELSTQYEAVVLDTAPLIPVADTVALAALAQGTILVVRASKTSCRDVKDACQLLEMVGARSLGTVFNMSSRSKQASYKYQYTPAPQPKTSSRRRAKVPATEAGRR
ncbi:polysaccharide biosynthesis tyrosine autokinase [Streptomyces sioyaensis]|uniref:polysaccharide biosynthesis tyrosine autokinase n=1 Tax=Streptomyces sioyaensis TaxID=67364 RepID=UPI00340381F9